MSFYGVVRAVVRAFGLVLWRVRVSGAEQVPLHGPVIIAANHRSYLDPPILGAFCPRQIAYMAKRELFAVPLLAPMIRALGAYPVDREGNAAAAIRRSIEVLRAGGAVGIFPEGSRNAGAAAARRGVALLASLTGAPVVPAALLGTDRAVHLSRIRVVYGAPLRLPQGRRATREELAAFTDDVMSTIRALAEEDLTRRSA